MDYQGFQLLRLGIILSLLTGISNCKNVPALFGSHKYITEAYFQKHDTLNDRNFQHFISSELSHVFCGKQNFIPKLSVIQRQLIGEGSHRRLTSSVKIEIQPEFISSIPLLSCKSIIIEKLPSGVFADPFELEHLTERGVFSGASAFGDTNLELPTIRANRSVVEVHMDLNPNLLSGNKNGWEINIELPLHVRYAPLGENGYTRVEFVSPDLFLNWIVEGDPHNKSCIFPSTNEGFKSNSDSIVWEVPSGILKHTKIVSAITFIAAVVGGLSILVACVFYSEISVHDGSKQF